MAPAIPAPAGPVAGGPALREAKRAVRVAVLAARDALGADERTAAANAITARVLALPHYAAATAVLLTLPFRSEWDTVPLARAALAAGKAVIVPRVDTQSRVLALHRVHDLEAAIVPGYRGIPEPRPDLPRASAADVTLALVPGVAFDGRGRRLGYGGGYYDRLLPLLAPAVPRIAGAYELQLVAEVPAATHDISVDVIVTPLRVLVLPPRA